MQIMGRDAVDDLLEEQEKTLKDQKQQIDRLQQIIYNLSTRSAQWEMSSSNISLEARVNKVNYYYSLIKENMYKITASVFLMDNQELNIEDAEGQVMMLLDQWSYSMSFEEVLAQESFVKINKCRPFFMLRNMRYHYDEENKRITDGILDICDKFDTRIRGISNSCIVFQDKHEDLLQGYLAVVAFMRILHLLDTDPFLMRYPGWSPTTVNYEEDEEYNEKVYQVNQLYIRDPKEINAKVKNKDKIQIKLKKKSQ